MKFTDASQEEIDRAMIASDEAFKIYRKKSFKERAAFLYAIAKRMEIHEGALIKLAVDETHLEPARLKSEIKRTIFQLTSYGKATEEGSWMGITIQASPSGNANEINLRKTMVPFGPVVVFGASNFPFAYSTTGGDTASALAAGCTVIVKGHPAHAATSAYVGKLIKEAAEETEMPEHVFIHLHGASTRVGETLVKHDLTKAVGFTGSFQGGKALFDMAAKRRIPIPVFAEMGSVNPVFLLPEKLKADPGGIATMFAKSITMSAGQFCTNPGILIGIAGRELQEFKDLLAKMISIVPPEKMLHTGIAKNFQHKRAEALDVKGVQVAGVFSCPVGADESIPTLAEVAAEDFLQNPLLKEEVFGPFALLVSCKDHNEMMLVAESFEGQLTCSLVATNEEVKLNSGLVEQLVSICGRLILNGVPTGVEVSKAMHHGGPFPATTDSRFTAVGPDAIKRFARPVCYQNWDNELLPDELKNENPLRLLRTVNGELTKDRIIL
jgi:alpha-ketoglutaric semialdehyde dehydrogenase